MQRPSTPKPGDPILAEHIAYLLSLSDQALPPVVPPLVRNNDGSIGLADAGGFWIKITGAPSGTKHPWKEQYATTGGGFADNVATGTTSVDSAYELNGSTSTLTGKIVRAWRDKSSGEVRFIFGAC
jgi:hypothetical protein